MERKGAKRDAAASIRSGAVRRSGSIDEYPSKSQKFILFFGKDSASRVLSSSTARGGSNRATGNAFITITYREKNRPGSRCSLGFIVIVYRS